MKRYGFTLAEVLITLGIIGVVSAMVIPTFTQSTQNAKIGPKLAKAVAGFEQATKACLNDAESDSLIGSGIGTGANFMGNISHHLKGSINDDTFMAADGTSYTIINRFSDTTGTFPHLTPVNTQIRVDINGDAAPNTDARDRFYFQLMDDGSLRPWGGSWEAEANRWNGDRGRCRRNVKPDDTMYCAGHVMENGLKVEYK